MNVTLPVLKYEMSESMHRIPFPDTYTKPADVSPLPHASPTPKVAKKQVSTAGFSDITVLPPMTMISLTIYWIHELHLVDIVITLVSLLTSLPRYTHYQETTFLNITNTLPLQSCPLLTLFTTKHHRFAKCTLPLAPNPG